MPRIAGRPRLQVGSIPEIGHENEGAWGRGTLGAGAGAVMLLVSPLLKRMTHGVK